MASNRKAELKRIAANFEEGEVYLLEGKKQVYLQKVTTPPSGVEVELFPISKNGKINPNKAIDTRIKLPTDLIPLESKQETFVKVSAKAIRKAEKVFKESLVVKEEGPTKGFAILKKEKKVVAIKILKTLKRGKRCAFRYDNDTHERTISEELIFDTKDKAKKALSNMGPISGREKTVDKKDKKVKAKGKRKQKGNGKDTSKKGYLLLKKSGTILDCTILEKLGKKYKIEVNLKGKVYKKLAPELAVFTTKTAAKKAAKS